MVSQEKSNYNREYYLKNRTQIIKRIQARQKFTQYQPEKTPEQRKVRNIKRKTRYHFPLTNQKCVYCGKQATERHHTTEPIEYDKFVNVCHDCHILGHRITKYGANQWQTT
jgi:predicted class III extradiol MEMO1 family dioxygenase